MSKILLAEAAGGGGMDMLLFMGMFFVIIYFFMIRPQTKKAKKQKALLADIAKGDRIVTVGGIHGKISEIDETTFLVEVDSGTKLRIEKSVISLDLTQALQDKVEGNKKGGDK